MPLAKLKSFKNKVAPPDSFVAHTLTLMTGSTLAQAIPILVSPIITRLYSPEDYGLFALFISITAIIGIVSTGRYEMAVMLPAKDEDAFDIVMLTCMIVLSFSLLLFTGIFFFKSLILKLIGNPDFVNWLYYIPPFVFITGIYQGLEYWLNRKKKFGIMASRKIIQTASTSATQLLMGVAAMTKFGLLAGALAGQGLSTGLVGGYIWKYEKERARNINAEKLKEKAKRYRDFPVYATPASLLDTASLQAPILMISFFFDAIYVGLFGLTMRVLALPVSLVGNAIGQVYYQRITELRNRAPDQVTAFIYQSAKYLALISIGPALILVGLGPTLFSFVFGETWREAGIFAQIISVAIAIRFVVSPLSTVMSVSENLRLGAKWKAIYFFTSYITLLIASQFNILIFMVIFAIHEMVLYLLYFHFLVLASKRIQ